MNDYKRNANTYLLLDAWHKRKIPAQVIHDYISELIEAAAQPKWLPIETAPKDGTKICAFNGMIERSESISGAGEAGANLNDLLCVTYHKKCHDCGRFLPRDRWVRTDDRRKAHGLCHDCYSKYDDPAFL